MQTWFEPFSSWLPYIIMLVCPILSPLLCNVCFLIFIFTSLFISLHWVLVEAHGIFDLHCSRWDLSAVACKLISCMWYANSRLGHVGSSSLTRDQTQAPSLGARNLSHWTTGGDRAKCVLNCFNKPHDLNILLGI